MPIQRAIDLIGYESPRTNYPVSVRIRPDLLVVIDKICAKLSFSRSDLINLFILNSLGHTKVDFDAKSIAVGEEFTVMGE